MKIFSSQFTKIDGTVFTKTVIIKKAGKKFTMVRHYTTEAENIASLTKNASVLIADDYQDSINETIQLPPVKDSKTFQIIARNKLRDSLDQTQEYLMAYKATGPASGTQPNAINYNVFITPKSVFDEDVSYISDKYSVSMFTVSDYVLCALTKRFFPGETVFHAYADGDRIIAVVCRDDVVLYTRSSQIQDAADMSGPYYEYVNLTYVYAAKNLKLDITNIIFSGDLANTDGLSDVFQGFSGKPISTLTPFGLIYNCSHEVFQKYIIPISMCYLNQSYDMTPEDVKEEQGRRSLTTLVNMAAAGLVALLFVLNGLAFLRLHEAKEELISQQGLFASKYKEFQKEIAELQSSKYPLYYYRELASAQKSPINTFSDLSQLLNLGNYSSVVFDTLDGGKRSVTIAGTFNFRKLNTLEAFSARYKKAMNAIKKTNRYDITDSSKLSANNMQIDISVKIITKDGADAQEGS